MPKIGGGYWWGDNVRDVCLKEWQFSCWNSNDPNSEIIKNVNLNNKKFKQCVDIATDVLKKKSSNPIEKATHYYAEYISAPKWVEKATYISKIGVHRFYKDIR